ncbi:MAG TPA: DUF5801 repeats-in-toxin domain-containing protein [Sphingobium sp.]|nr:DUF5801 repeats-in-toxin domain-containing protein [Sphingobium sp.]
MTLTIQDLFYDEQFGVQSDDNDVTALSAGIPTISLTTVSSPTGFPQYAEYDDFVSSNNQVTDYFFAKDGTGTLFSTTVGTATTMQVNDGGTLKTIYLFATSDPNILVGRVGSSVNDAVALKIAIGEHVSGGLVTSADLGVTVYAPIVHSVANAIDDLDIKDLTNFIFLGSTYNTATEVPFENFASVKSGQDAFAPVVPTSGANTTQLLITGFAGSTVGTVNVSTTGLGTNAQHVDPTESIRVDIVTGLDTSGALTSTFVHDAANISYGNHVDAIRAEFSISQLNPTNTPATLSVFAYQDDNTTATSNYQGTAFPTSAISDPGTVVQIDPEDVIIKNAAGDNITTAFKAGGGTIVADGQGVKITGLLATQQVNFSTDGVLFDRFVITNTLSGKGPSTFDVGAIEVTTLVGGTAKEYAEFGSKINFEDGGPNIDAGTDPAPTLSTSDALLNSASADFHNLFTNISYGPDGAGSISYDIGTPGLGVDSGMVDSQTGFGIFLYLEDNTDTPLVGDHKVVGRVGTSATTPSASGAVAFSIAADPGTGEVSMTQSRAVYHDKLTNDTSVSFDTADLVTLTATIKDGETNADTDSATINIALSFSITDDVPTVTPRPVAPGDPSLNDLFVGNTNGASATSFYTLDTGNDTPGHFTITDAPDSSGFSYVSIDTDGIAGNEIKGFYDPNTSDAIPGTALYTLKLDADGHYTFTMIGTLPSSTLNLSSAEIKAGAPDTNSIDVGAVENDDYVTIAGGGGPINESNGFVGVKNGNLDVGESLTFTLHEGDGTEIDFQGLIIGTKSAKASSYSVHIDYVDPAKTDTTTQFDVPKNTALVVDPAGDDLIQSITVTKLSGPALKIGVGDIDILLPPQDVKLGFTVQLADSDQDTDSQSFSVSIDGNNDGSFDDTITASSTVQPLSLLGASTTDWLHFM